MSKFGPGDQIIGKGRVQLTVVAATDRQYWLQGDDGYCATYRASVIDLEWSKLEPRFEVGGVYRRSVTEYTVVAVFDEGKTAIAWYQASNTEQPARLLEPSNWRRVR